MVQVRQAAGREASSVSTFTQSTEVVAPVPELYIAARRHQYIQNNRYVHISYYAQIWAIQKSS